MIMIEKKAKINDWNIQDCPVRTVLDKFGDKWSILILLILGQNTKMRFNELNKEIDDISQKMLTVTLRSLEADGLVNRTIYPEIPPRVEYEITPLGKSLVPHIDTLSKWAIENLNTIKASRKKFERSK
jgi:DNA-binding HxlR family transcriptional regulator